MTDPKDHKYFRKCWACGSSGFNMQMKRSFVQCSNCGATWNPVLKGGPPIVEVDPTPATEADRARGTKALRPATGYIKKLAAAREARSGLGNG